MSKLLRGNEAIMHAALLAGCRAFFGYPITPASEITEAAALLMPRFGRVFLQAESEIAAIQMVYGAAAGGVRVMTASAGPGISLMQEGFSFLAAVELPCVVVDVMRAGPGLGTIGPAQGDYSQIVKGGGHGDYHNIVLAPNSVQEMLDLTVRAFDLADRYRNPVVILADGVLGQMMEAITLPEHVALEPAKPWAVAGDAKTRRNFISSIKMENREQEKHVEKLERKYRQLRSREADWEEYRVQDAEVLIAAYGITSRVARAAVDLGRVAGLRVGLFRPITLYPFPSTRLLELSRSASGILVLELSTGQFIEDVRLAVNGCVAVRHMYRTGGMVPTAEEVLEGLGEKEIESARSQA